ncbi:hypothetical protein [Candidatus Lokiarchaeum ossiferum]|uniref:hypothetical protein n=1 Tax=Candidatus Lokiarchaeum ossiferum TaxID=2951803 RepID=UPI00352DA873
MQSQENLNNEQPQQFVKWTNIITELAFLLLFLLALPGVAGLVCSGISFLFISGNELFLSGEVNLGMFILGFLVSLPIFFYLYLKTRRKKIYNFITPMVFRKKLSLSLIILYFPAIFASTVFSILGTALGYDLYLTTFQIAIFTIFPLISIFFQKFFLLRVRVTDSLKENLTVPINSKFITELKNGQIFLLFLKSAVINIAVNLLLLILGGLYSTVLSINLTFSILSLIAVQVIAVKFNEAKALGLGILVKLLSTFLILASFISLSVLVYSETIPVPLYVILVLILTLKLALLNFKFSIQKFLNQISYTKNLTWLVVLNTCSSIIINLGVIITSFVLIDSPYIQLVIQIGLIIENLFESKMGLIHLKISPLFLIAQLLVANIHLSFFIVMDVSGIFWAGLLTFTALGIGILELLKYQNFLTQKQTFISRNCIYIAILLELALLFSTLAVANDLNINNIPFLTYLFFISVSTLISSFLLNKIYFADQPSKFFTTFLYGNLGIILFCFFVMIQNIILPFSTDFVSGGQRFSRTFLFFSPSGVLSNIEEALLSIFDGIGSLSNDQSLLFKSSDGLVSLFNVSLSSLLSVGLNLVIFKFLHGWKLISNELYKKLQIILQILSIVAISNLIVLITLDLTGFVFSLIVTNVLVKLSIYYLYKSHTIIKYPSVYHDLQNNFSCVIFGQIILWFGFLLGESFETPFLYIMAACVILLLIGQNNIPIVKRKFSSIESSYHILKISNAIAFGLLTLLVIIIPIIEFSWLLGELDFVFVFSGVVAYVSLRLLYKTGQNLHLGLVLTDKLWKRIQYILFNFRLLSIFTFLTSFIISSDIFNSLYRIFRNAENVIPEIKFAILFISLSLFIFSLRLKPLLNRSKEIEDKPLSKIATLQVIMVQQMSVLGVLFIFLPVSSFNLTITAFLIILLLYSFMFSINQYLKHFNRYCKFLESINFLIYNFNGLLFSFFLFSIITIDLSQNWILGLLVGISAHFIINNVIQWVKSNYSEKTLHIINLIERSLVLILAFPALYLFFSSLSSPNTSNLGLLSLLFESKFVLIAILSQFLFIITTVLSISRGLYKLGRIKSTTHENILIVSIESYLLTIASMFASGIHLIFRAAFNHRYAEYVNLILCFVVSTAILTVMFFSNFYKKRIYGAHNSKWRGFWILQHLISWTLFWITLSLGFVFLSEYSLTVIVVSLSVNLLAFNFTLSSFSKLYPELALKFQSVISGIQITIYVLIAASGAVLFYDLFQFILPLVVLIGCSLFLVEIHFVPLFSEGIFKNRKHLMNGVIGITNVGLAIVTILQYLARSDIYLFAINPSATISGILGIFALGLIFANYQIFLGNRISPETKTTNNFILVNGFIYASYSLVVSIFIQVTQVEHFYLFKIANYLFIFFLPLILLYGVLRVMVYFKAYESSPKFFKILQYQEFALWTVSSNLLLVLILVFLEFNPVITGYNVVLICYSLIYSLDLLRTINPHISNITESLKNVIKQLSIVIMAYSSYVNFNRVLEYSPEISLILTLSSQLFFIFLLKPYRKLLAKILIQLTAMVTFIISVCAAFELYDLAIHFGQFKASYTCLLLLIPLVGSFITILILSKLTSIKRIASQIHALLYSLVIVDLAGLVYFAAVTYFFPIDSIFFASLVIPVLLIVDRYTFRLLMTDKLFILCLTITYSIVSSLFSIILVKNVVDRLKYQIPIAFILEILFVTGLLIYIVWHYDKNEEYEFITESDTQPNNDDENGDEFEIPFIQARSENPSQKLSHSIFTHLFQIKVALMIVLFINTSLIVIFNSVDSEIAHTPFNVASLGILALYALSMIPKQQVQLLKFYIIAGLTVFLSIQSYWFGTGILSSILIISNLIAINWIVSSRKSTSFNGKLLLNLLVLGLYFFNFKSFNIDFFTLNGNNMLELSILASVICYELGTTKHYKNLMFKSLKNGAIAYFISILTQYFLGPSFKNEVLVPILVPIAIFLTIFATLEWFLVELSYPGYKSIPKSICGYVSLIGIFFVYSQFYKTFSTVFGYITAPVLLFVIIGAILLKNVDRLRHRKNLLNQVVLVATFGFFLFSGLNYIFISFENPLILSILLSTAIGGYLYTFMYNWLEIKTSKNLIITTLTSGAVSAGAFFYFFLTDLKIYFNSTHSFAVAIDFCVLMFFIALGIYYKSFQKVWSIGAYVWIIVPIANFIIISYSLQDIDYIIEAIHIGSNSVNGSIILAVVVCSLLYLPVLLTKLKKHFNKIIYIFWLEMFMCAYWAATNIFPSETLLQWVFAGAIGLILILPILYIYKKWNWMSLAWPSLCATNIVFISNYLSYLPPHYLIPIDVLIGGIFLLSLGYFPNIKKIKSIWQNIIIISGYMTILGGLFALINPAMIFLLEDKIISAAVTTLIMSFVLLSGTQFRIRDDIVKHFHAYILILDIAVIIWRTFYLVGVSLLSPEAIVITHFSVFGILLGLSFAFGTALSFQARNYLRKRYHFVLWFFMALFFGLSVFQLLLAIFEVGPWASTGVLILATSLMCFNFFKKKIALFNMVMISGTSLVLMNWLSQIDIFQNYIGLIFIDVVLLLVFIYLYLTQDSKYQLLNQTTENKQLVASVWLILSIALSITTSLILTSIQAGGVPSKILLGIIVFNFLNIPTYNYIQKNNLFAMFTRMNEILKGIKIFLFQSIVLSGTLLISLNIPFLIQPNTSHTLFQTFLHHAGLFFLLQFIYYEFVEKYWVHLIPEKIRLQVSSGIFLILSLSFYGNLLYILDSWQLSTIILGILSFYTIELNVKAKNIQNSKVFRVVVLSAMNICLFLMLWDPLMIGYWLSRGKFESLSLSLFIVALIYFVGMKIHFISSKFVIPAYVITTSLFGIFVEEILRNVSKASIFTILGTFLIILCFSNFFLIKNPKSVHLYWLVASFAITCLIHGGIQNYLMSDFGKSLFFFCTLGTILTVIYYILASQSHAPASLSNLDIGDQQVSKSEKSLTNSILLRIPMKNRSQLWFINTYLISSFLISIGINQGWYSLLTKQLIEISPLSSFSSFILYSCSAMIGFLLGLILIAQYIENEDQKSQKHLQALSTKSNQIAIRYGVTFATALTIFIDLWFILDIWTSILDRNFDLLTLNLVIALVLVYLCMRLKFIPKKGMALVTLIISILISLYVEELIRINLSIGPIFNSSIFTFLFNSSVFVILFILFNWQKTYNSILAYTFWSLMSYSLTTFINTLIRLVLPSSFSPFNEIVVFSFIFSILTTIIFGRLAIPRSDKLDVSSPSNSLPDGDLNTSTENDRQKIPTRTYLKYGHPDQRISQHIFVYWVVLIANLVISFTLAYAWNQLALTKMFYYEALSGFMNFIISFTLAFAIFAGIFRLVIKYTRKNSISFSNRFETINYPVLDVILGYLGTLCFNITLFIHLWYQFDTVLSLEQLNFMSLLLNVTINTMIVSLLMKFAVIKPFKPAFFSFINSIVFSLLIEELIRMVFADTLFNISVFLFLFTVINWRKTYNSVLAYIFWSVLSFSFSSFLYTFIRLALPESFSPFNEVVVYSFIICMFTSVIYGRMANHPVDNPDVPYMIGPTMEEKTPQPSENNNQKVPSIIFLKYGHPDQQISKRRFVYWTLFANFIVCSILAYAWNRLILTNLSFYEDLPLFMEVLTCLTLAFAIYAGITRLILKYNRNESVIFANIFENMNKPLVDIVYGYVGTFAMNLTLFIHLWYLFNTAFSLDNSNYTSLLFNLSINTLIVSLLMKNAIIKPFKPAAFSFINSIVFSLFIEELIRTNLETALLLNISIFVILFTVINWRKTYNSLLAYGFWTAISFSISTFLYELIGLTLPASYTIFNKVLVFAFIFCLITTFLFGSLANHFVDRMNLKVLSVSNSEDENKLASTTTSNPNKEIILLKYGHSNQLIAQRIFVYWLLLASVINTFILTYGWNQGILSQLSLFSEVGGFMNFVMNFSLASAVLMGFLRLIIQYNQKMDIKLNRSWNKLNSPITDEILGYLGTFAFNASLFLHIWNLLEINSHLILLDFTGLVFNLAVNFLIITLLMKFNVIKPYKQVLASIFTTLLFSLLLEEMVRISNPDINWNLLVAITILSFTIFNTLKIKTSKMVYSYWASLILCITVFIMNSVILNNPEMMPLTVLYFSVIIFSSFALIVSLSLSHRFWIKIAPWIGEKYNSVKNKSSNQEEIPFKLENSNEAPKEILSNSSPENELVECHPNFPLLLLGNRSHLSVKKIFSILVFAEILLTIPYLSHLLNGAYIHSIKNIALESIYSDFSFLSLFAVFITFSFTYLFGKLGKYIQKYQLWAENPKLYSNIQRFFTLSGIIYYIILPLMLMGYLNQLFGLIPNLTLFIRTALDILIVVLGLYIGIYLLDIKKNHFIPQKIAFKCTIILSILMALDISTLYISILWGKIPPYFVIASALIIFSLSLNILHIIKEFSEELKENIRVGIIGSLYVEVLLLISGIIIGRFENLAGKFSSILIIVLFIYLAIELEYHVKWIKPITSFISTIRPYSYIIATGSIAILIGFWGFSVFNLSLVIFSLMLFTASLILWSYLEFRKDNPEKFLKNRKVLGIALYAEILLLINALTLNLYIDKVIRFDIVKSDLLAVFCAITQLFIVSYLILLVDHRVLKLIKESVLKILELGCFFVSIILGAFDILFYIISKTSSRPSTPSSGFAIPNTSILIPILIVTAIIGFVLHLRFKNKIVNQVSYFVGFFELALIIFKFGEQNNNSNNILLGICIFVALLLYPFIFFMDKMRVLIKKLIMDLKNLVIRIKNWFIQAWYTLVDLYHKYRTIVFVVIASIIGAIPPIILSESNLIIGLFIGGLIFLIVIYPVSPEKLDDISAKTFTKKIIYRSMILLSAFGIIISLFEDPESWIFSLLVWALFGYILVIVKRREELYKLPIYWRFFSALATILLSILTVVLVIISFI